MSVSFMTLSISVCVPLLVKTLDECYHQAEIVLGVNESAYLLNLPLPGAPLPRSLSLSARLSV